MRFERPVRGALSGAALLVAIGIRESRAAAEPRFIVDPIDGTRNFVGQIPFWAVLDLMRA
jgi:fructose-1,6-bisphosphatase/inositol monophosphatase family enzyme